ncbi:MAG: hypothetical protein H7Y13_12080 [Sphingobacteriaceae bacterium]|nr:hypothetical protein [Sphingobacteriaceae bacterium]
MKNLSFLSFLSLAFLTLFCVTSCSDKSFDAPDGQVKSKSEKVHSTVSHDDTLHADVDGTYQAQANEYLQKIHAAFSSTPGREKNGISDYPGYYGGAYINPQGKLVVLIKGESDKERKNITKIIGTDNFITMPCKHSYKSLVKIMTDLNEFKLNKANASKSANFNAYALVDAQNLVIVELDNFNEKKIEEFRKTVMNSSGISFERSPGRCILQGALKPGCPAQVDAGTGSFAFRAKRSSDAKEGMVTAGHIIPVGGSLYENGVKIGTCSASRQSGSVDAAFIPINDPVTYFPSQLICNTADVLSTQTSQPGVGTVVNMRGTTTGYSSGSIISTNASTTTAGGITYTNLTSADYASASGDSGGIIYTYISSTNTRPTVGIHLGNNTIRAYFTKADLALSALGVYRY